MNADKKVIEQPIADVKAVERVDQVRDFSHLVAKAVEALAAAARALAVKAALAARAASATRARARASLSTRESATVVINGVTRPSSVQMLDEVADP